MRNFKKIIKLANFASHKKINSDQQMFGLF